MSPTLRDWIEQPIDEQLLQDVQEILASIHNWFYIEGRPENNDRVRDEKFASDLNET